MDQATHNKIVSFIWGIADDVLRDLFKRGKYPDVILPMCVLRRMDAVLEPTKQAVLETKEMLDKAGITEQRAALAAAAGQSFYNTSRFTLRDPRFKVMHQGEELSLVKAIESLRFASGDEALRSALYDEFGDRFVNDFPAVAVALEKRLAEWGNDEEEEQESEEGTPARKGLPEKKKWKLLDASTWADDARLVATANALRQELGRDVFEDYSHFRDRVDDALDKLGVKPSASGLKTILRAVSWRVETAPPVIAKVHKPGKGGRAAAIQADPLHGLYSLAPSDGERVGVRGKPGAIYSLAPSDGERGGVRGKPEVIVEYEPDPDLRDTEQVPLLEPGGIKAFIRREVLPYTPDAWVKEDATKIGYEISFTRHFYQPQPLRTLEEIRADILAVQQEAEGLLDELVRGGVS